MKIEITGEYIKIGQLLKKMKLIDSGGKAKWFLQTYNVRINRIRLTNRSSKVRPGDTLWIEYKVYSIVAAKAE